MPLAEGGRDNEALIPLLPAGQKVLYQPNGRPVVTMTKLLELAGKDTRMGRTTGG